jgi:hypothetical protein
MTDDAIVYPCVTCAHHGHDDTDSAIACTQCTTASEYAYSQCLSCVHHDHASIAAQSACSHCEDGSKHQDPEDGYPSGTVDDEDRYPSITTIQRIEMAEAAYLAELLRQRWDNVSLEDPTRDGVRIVVGDDDTPDRRVVLHVNVELS